MKMMKMNGMKSRERRFYRYEMKQKESIEILLKDMNSKYL